MVMFQNKVPSHGWHMQALESRPAHVKNEKQLTETLPYSHKWLAARKRQKLIELATFTIIPGSTGSP